MTTPSVRLGPPLRAALALMVAGAVVLAAVPRHTSPLPPLNVRGAATDVRAADLALGAFESCLSGARDELAVPVEASTIADATRAETRFRSCVTQGRTSAVAAMGRVDALIAGSVLAGPAGRVLTQADTAGRLAMAEAGAITATFPRVLTNLRAYLGKVRTHSSSAAALRALLADDGTFAAALQGLRAADAQLADADVTLSGLPAAVSARP